MEDKKTKLLRKAALDKAFRAALLKNPAAAIEKETGVKVPEGVVIKVVVDSAEVVHLILPAAPKAGEPPEKDLFL